ncbi:MAG: hypothetical protein NWR51_14140 [Akkermansiaceae bacterium]|jgi:hypothetical protein|nr:hypothetical protein [Akkermansiaceae bacterium]MDP4792001.1 hypothetical protein [Verrucomicrobiales bacterium]MDP4848391.1 hypothetical protein [Akkermansiaceae bacterium]MDP4898353.1 hypothetical protein [Akkermansiaceae bacterium]
MTKQKLLVPAAICLLAIALSIILISSESTDDAGNSASQAGNIAGAISANASSLQETESKTKHEREDPSAAIARRNLEKEFDEILPAQFPGQFSSICDVALKSDESLILGGFKTSKGNYEFTEVKVIPSEAGNGENQYLISVQSLILTPEKSAEIGFDTLVSPARTRIQKSLIVNSQDIDLSGDGVPSTLSIPPMVTNANSPATCSINYPGCGYAVSTMVSPQGDGESVRLRTRIEIP